MERGMLLHFAGLTEFILDGLSTDNNRAARLFIFLVAFMHGLASGTDLHVPQTQGVNWFLGRIFCV